MPAVVVAGGSVAGLATALALSGTGHRVLVLERAAPPPEGPPAEAAGRWRRPTVPQSAHAHTLTSLGVRVLRERAPQVLEAAVAAGAVTLDLTAALPADAVDGGRAPGDEDLVGLGCRRAVLELVLHRVVRELPGVAVRHETAVGGLELDPSGQRVRAVITTTGERVPADLVVDATGRQALSRTWLRIAGVPVADDRTSPSGLTGWTRFYRLTGTERPGPLGRGNAAGGIWDHYAGVLHPADGGVFSVALGTLPGDRAMAELRLPSAFTAVARATPGVAPWLADGVSEPVSPVQAITSPPNTLRGLATTAQRPVAGLFPVGDAACVTDPLFGRGVSLALEHAFRLADVLAAHPDAGIAQSRAVAQMTEELFLPWYEQAVGSDRVRIARWRAAINGAAPPRPEPAEGVPTIDEIAAAAQRDGQVWRGLTRMLMTLTTPAQLLGDDKFVARVRQAAGDPGADLPRPGGAPPRDELLRLLAGARRAAV
ncbi:FAD-dependent oxidoreductase [Streptomyces aurantiogriseus]|uniref:FAD-dependent oxidoreductase n=1 Tax=Streptomyces aurantiogriseus TaxID=66870 RepID=A0A918F312_9ACTN|nr:hypothetical protein [Streptomyces aurantiogriseus]GGR02614.1 hypothetical protein GCM10010251_18020 [Streptomyces aurantiogriseus]